MILRFEAFEFDTEQRELRRDGVVLAIVTEVIGTTSMRLSEGFARPVFSVPIVVFREA